MKHTISLWLTAGEVVTQQPYCLSSVIAQVPQLQRGRVWCTECGHSRRVDVAFAMRYEWPKCCGATMTIDSPEERDAIAARATRGTEPQP